MNIYFLVEGRRTERKVYPRWLSHLVPHLKRVKNFDEVEHHNYYLFSSNGYPSIMADIENAVADVNHCGRYSYFVVCLDSEESSVKERHLEINRVFESRPLELKAQLEVVVQNICFETWFLSNRKVYSRYPQDETFKRYSQFYNVSTQDPELMPVFPGFNSKAQFHEDYLKRMLREKGLRYTKRNPGDVGSSHYIDELQKRIRDCPGQLESLNSFFSFCRKINPL